MEGESTNSWEGSINKVSASVRGAIANLLDQTINKKLNKQQNDIEKIALLVKNMMKSSRGGAGDMTSRVEKVERSQGKIEAKLDAV